MDVSNQLPYSICLDRYDKQLNWTEGVLSVQGLSINFASRLPAFAILDVWVSVDEKLCSFSYRSPKDYGSTDKRCTARAGVGPVRKSEVMPDNVRSSQDRTSVDPSFYEYNALYRKGKQIDCEQAQISAELAAGESFARSQSESSSLSAPTTSSPFAAGAEASWQRD
jgi:hypothetical protein